MIKDIIKTKILIKKIEDIDWDKIGRKGAKIIKGVLIAFVGGRQSKKLIKVLLSPMNDFFVAFMEGLKK